FPSSRCSCSSSAASETRIVSEPRGPRSGRCHGPPHVSGVLGQPDPPRSRLGYRFAVFGLAVMLAAAGLTTRLFYLQIGRGGYYSSVNGDNRLSVAPIPAVRGLIYDRAGRPLATNVAS